MKAVFVAMYAFFHRGGVEIYILDCKAIDWNRALDDLLPSISCKKVEQSFQREKVNGTEVEVLYNMGDFIAPSVGKIRGKFLSSMFTISMRQK